MPSYKNAFPSKWVKATELPKNKRIEVTISKVVLEDVGQNQDKKLVAYFQHKQKGVVLNISKCSFLEELSGTDDYNAWRGLSFIIYPGRTTYMGKPVDCIVFDYGADGTEHVVREPEREPEPDVEDWGAIPNDDDVPF